MTGIYDGRAGPLGAKRRRYLLPHPIIERSALISQEEVGPALYQN